MNKNKINKKLFLLLIFLLVAIGLLYFKDNINSFQGNLVNDLIFRELNEEGITEYEPEEITSVFIDKFLSESSRTAVNIKDKEELKKFTYGLSKLEVEKIKEEDSQRKYWVNITCKKDVTKVMHIMMYVNEDNTMTIHIDRLDGNGKNYKEEGYYRVIGSDDIVKFIDSYYN